MARAYDLRWMRRFVLSVGSLFAIGACTLLVDTNDLSKRSRDASAPGPASEGGPLLGEGGASSSGGPSDGQAPPSYADMIQATPGVIAYWRFGEPVGATSAASSITSAPSGKINAGVTLGAPSVIRDGDTSFAFNDTNEMAVVDFGRDVFAFEGKTPFSIELWHAPSSLQGFQALISKHNLASSGAEGWVLSVEDPYGYGVYREDGQNGDAVETRLVPVAGEVHHLVATYDGTYLHLYVDAKEPKPPRLCERSLPGTSSVPVRVGASTFGRIDEVALYNRALSIEEVSQHYDRGK